MITTFAALQDDIKQLQQKIDNHLTRIEGIKQLVDKKHHYNSLLQDKSSHESEILELKSSIEKLEHETDTFKYAGHLVLGTRPNFAAIVAQSSPNFVAIQPPKFKPEPLGIETNTELLQQLGTELEEMQRAITELKQVVKEYDPKYFIVPEGQLTFDEEGIEGDPKSRRTWRYHSRKPQVPPGNSGLTIGRGYDLSKRESKAVEADLVAIGLTHEQASVYAGAVGLTGGRARYYINHHDLVELTPKQQLILFQMEYKRMKKEVKRIYMNEKNEKDTDWVQLNSVIVEILVDLRYRGDYTPRTRHDKHKRNTKQLSLHESVAQNNLSGVIERLAERMYWSNATKVSVKRINARLKYARGALAASSQPSNAGQLIANSTDSPLHVKESTTDSKDNSIVEAPTK